MKIIPWTGIEKRGVKKDMSHQLEVAWPKINEYLLHLNSQRNQPDLCKTALKELSGLIAYDTAYFFIVDQQRQAYNFEVLNVPEKSIEAYLNYYEAIDPCRAKTPPTASTMATDWNELGIRNTEFAADYARPNEIHYTAGLQFHNDQGIPCGALVITRSRSGKGFSDSEMSHLAIIKPHLNNLYNFMANSTSSHNTAPGLLDNTDLTNREKEIAALVCQGLNTQAISSLLIISPQTVYQHIKKIFKKLDISSRPELIAKISGLAGSKQKTIPD
jgi:DNA-binding CsgD family transcriptional regulator